MIFFQTFSCVIIVFSSTNTIKRGNSLRHCPRQPRQGRRFHDQVIATSFSSYSNPPSSLTDRVRWPRTLDPICRMLRCWQPWTVVGCCEVNTNTNILTPRIRYSSYSYCYSVTEKTANTLSTAAPKLDSG